MQFSKDSFKSVLVGFPEKQSQWDEKIYINIYIYVSIYVYKIYIPRNMYIERGGGREKIRNWLTKLRAERSQDLSQQARDPVMV